MGKRSFIIIVIHLLLWNFLFFAQSSVSVKSAINIASILSDSVDLEWRAYYSRERTSSLFYSIINDRNIIRKSNYYFPEYTPFDSVITIAYNPFKYVNNQIRKLNLSGYNHLWYKKFDKQILVDSIFLYQRVYSRNISEYSILIYSPLTENWYKKIFKINSNGYQIPSKVSLTSFEKVSPEEDTSIVILNSIPSNLLIDRMVVYYQQSIDNSDAELVFGEFYIGKIIFEDILVHHPFFENFIQENNLKDYDKNTYNTFYSLPGLPILFGTETQYLSMGIDNAIFFHKNKNSANEIRLLAALLYRVLEKYPFYFERKLNKDNILEQFKNILNNVSDSTTIEDFSKSVQPLITNFKDPHFTIFIPRKDGKYLDKFPGPIRLTEIDKRIFVSAIFNDSLKNYIDLEDEIVTVNDTSITLLIDNGMQDEYGTFARQRNKALAKILNRSKDDSVCLTIVDKFNNKKRVNVPYNCDITIPDVFYPMHCQFLLDSSFIAYFRINKWDNNVYIAFLNNIENIQRSKGVIFDVRGNSGGSTFPAQKITSLFINHPIVYNEIIPYREENSKESLVIRPNGKYFIDKPVVLIGDENTSCASEEFILAMKKTGRALFIGPERTAGTIAPRHDFYLSSGVILSTNSIANKLVDRELGVVECRGVEPDIYVKRNSVYDLYPYQDKILKAAKKYIIQFINDRGTK
jgi:C-terminal processing protease CtpA/Prc